MHAIDGSARYAGSNELPEVHRSAAVEDRSEFGLRLWQVTDAVSRRRTASAIKPPQKMRSRNIRTRKSAPTVRRKETRVRRVYSAHTPACILYGKFVVYYEMCRREGTHDDDYCV